MYDKLTELFNELPRYRFPYKETDIDPNGIYVLFEAKEKHNDLDRIVRIGSHTKSGGLIERIDNHFRNEDQRDSIFRKHIGRCMLTIDKNNYITSWNLRIKRKEDKLKNISKIDFNIEEVYEKRVTCYIRNNFSFSVIPNLTDKDRRICLEKRLISTFAQYEDRNVSKQWIGRFHPDPRLSKAGLWNIHNLKTKPITNEDYGYITNVIL